MMRAGTPTVILVEEVHNGILWEPCDAVPTAPSVLFPENGALPRRQSANQIDHLLLKVILQPRIVTRGDTIGLHELLDVATVRAIPAAISNFVAPHVPVWKFRWKNGVELS